MEASVLPVLDEVEAELVAAKLGIDAVELHGLLCGYLSAGGAANARDWLLKLGLEDESTIRPAQSALHCLFEASCFQLGSPDLGFVLLLPDDATPVTRRAEAMLEWCRGFLSGFGLAPDQRPELSPEASEALDDLAKIAASNLSYDDPEGDEVALVEIAEFVRVAALLLHGDCNAPESARRLH